MSRLTDTDKTKIIDSYRNTGETTLTLAEQYGVSNTTISRILKSSLSAEEYESLIQQKRSASRGGAKTATIETPAVQGNLLETPKPEPPKIEEPVVSSKPEPPRRVRKRSSAVEEAPPVEEVAQVVEAIAEDFKPTPSEMLDEDDEDDLDDDLDDLDSLDEDDDDDEPAILPSIQLSAAEFIRVLPIAEAAIPRTCYLVVDRSAELVARPLSEFAELGQIPSGEVEEKTLPVFDNHRVAKRFSNIRTQRVIKVPDSRILQKAAPYLQAKGITRLLIDGQVYAL
ncbi:hypothetical protein LEP3755_43720 [Leptolyngbya sp. NIES-3755]|nr:hypothetical protein LEP3755_43720 [Leptolyngbya sp. NIES-3755]